IEDVSRVRLAAWRTPQQKGDLAIRLRMLRKIVVDHQRVSAAIAEVLADRACGVRADVQHWRWVGRRRGDHNRVAHRVVLFERSYDLRTGGLLLSNRVVDDNEPLLPP